VKTTERPIVPEAFPGLALQKELYSAKQAG
jgi:hypothetical protein